MSGFKSYGEDDFDRVFIQEYEIIDRFYGRGLWTWGANASGQLGDGTTTARSSPGTIAGGGVTWAQISNSGYMLNFSSQAVSQYAGVKTDGTLWTWGPNNIGQLGDNTTTNRSSPGTTSGGGTDWKQVSVGGYVSGSFQTHMAAVKTDGTLWTWGVNSGQLGTGNTTARSSPGTTVGGGTNWKQVSMGAAIKSAAAIKTDGTLWTWGSNGNGQLGDNTITNRSSPGTTIGGGTTWKSVSMGFTAGAIKTDGTLWLWGRNDNGGVGDGTTTERSSPVTTTLGGTDWKQVSTSRFTSAAVKTDGSIYVWGFNSSGQLGDNTTVTKSSPITPVIGAQTKWKAVTMGFDSAIAIADT